MEGSSTVRSLHIHSFPRSKESAEPSSGANMSRFFAGDRSDSDSETSASDSDGPVAASAVAAPTRFEFESSDSEEVRSVRCCCCTSQLSTP